MFQAQFIASRLGGAVRTSNGYDCKCPSHEDGKASLSITEKAGKLVWHCHAGCDQATVMQALIGLGLLPKAKKEADPLPQPKIDLPKLEPKQEPKPSKLEEEAVYDYVNESGELLYQAVRYRPKTFRQRRPNGSGGYIWSLGDTRRVLYRLPAVLDAASRGETVLILEGEKDVHTAESLGFVATCNVGGAKKWKDEYSQALKGASVIIIPDNDQPGYEHHDQVLESLERHGVSCRTFIVQTKWKDLTDCVTSHGVDGVKAAIEASVRSRYLTKVIDNTEAPEQKDPVKDPLFVDAIEIIDNLKPIDWLVEDFFENDALSMVFGAPGSGKSFITVSLACSVATGSPWFGRPVKQGTVFYIAGEGHNGLARRFKAWTVDSGVGFKAGTLFKSKKAISILDEKAALELYETVKAIAEASGEAPRLVVIDTLARSFGEGDENSTEDMGKFIKHVDNFIRIPFGCNVMLVHHSGHDTTRARGSSALKAALDQEYQVEAADGVVSFCNRKMKDAEPPQDMTFKFKGVELGEIDGEPIVSVVLDPQEDPLGYVFCKDSSGENVTAKKVVMAYKDGSVNASTLKDILNVSPATAKRIMAMAANRGLLTKSNPGHDRSSYVLTNKATELMSICGNEILEKSRKTPVWKREQNQRVDLDG